MSATAGTTVYGAFDPLLAVADICKKYKIWMHVDVSTHQRLAQFLDETHGIRFAFPAPHLLPSLSFRMVASQILKIPEAQNLCNV